MAESKGRYSKITVVLRRVQIAMLDRLAVSIRLRNGVAISRASIIEAFIEVSRARPDAVVAEMLQRRVPENKDRSGKPRRA